MGVCSVHGDGHSMIRSKLFPWKVTPRITLRTIMELLGMLLLLVFQSVSICAGDNSGLSFASPVTTYGLPPFSSTLYSFANPAGRY
jgi:hypothetical protein